ncbi:TetR/AcrR family transcriptional regulator [Mycobacterium sp.]|uniref:TetR/AcrR family transcriptional regulator n=1 Tax=Mycobacterium sp. TaxID=1785 RepID=UPI00120BDEAE|nr:TetR/AcrR family transcriptional regulator [Mycobacterium sp.]TAM69746.1 MAG: TetR/AcrR family transcriptional regulator [Mycobacterium sp.]
MADIILLSAQGRMLLAVAEDAGRPTAQLAAAAGMTVGAAEAVLAELVDAGCLDTADSSYSVNSSAQVRLSGERRMAVGAVVAAMLGGEGIGSLHATRRDVVRARLLTAIEALFDHGETFAGLTVERLISEAGLSRSTFYTYFTDKTELLQELAADVLEELLFDAAAHWWERDRIASREELHEGTRRIILAFVKHRVIMRAMSDAAATNAAIREQWGGLMRESAGLVARHIKIGQAAGFIDASLDPEATGTWLNWAAERSLTMLVAPSTPDDAARWHTVMTDLYWNVLYRGAA